MDMVDLEAMMVRAKAVRRLIKNGTLTGEEALALIVVPPLNLLEASRERVGETGVSQDTIDLFAARAAARRPQADPGHVRGNIVTLDELVSEH